eukprot:5115823-Pleurochrysis_carterae.AAC.4
MYCGHFYVHTLLRASRKPRMYTNLIILSTLCNARATVHSACSCGVRKRCAHTVPCAAYVGSSALCVRAAFFMHARRQRVHMQCVLVACVPKGEEKKGKGKSFFFILRMYVWSRTTDLHRLQKTMAPKNRARNKPNNKSMEERMKNLERAIANIEQKIQSVRLEQGSSRSNARPVGSFSRGRILL